MYTSFYLVILFNNESPSYIAVTWDLREVSETTDLFSYVTVENLVFYVKNSEGCFPRPEWVR